AAPSSPLRSFLAVYAQQSAAGARRATKGPTPGHYPTGPDSILSCIGKVSFFNYSRRQGCDHLEPDPFRLAEVNRRQPADGLVAQGLTGRRPRQRGGKKRRQVKAFARAQVLCGP